MPPIPLRKKNIFAVFFTVFIHSSVPQNSADRHLENVFSDQQHRFVSHWAKTHVHPVGLPGYPDQTTPKGTDRCLQQWNNDQIKLITKTFASYCTFKCVMCVYSSLSFSVTNQPETVSRPGERADDVCLPQLFVTSNGTHPCVHAQNSWYIQKDAGRFHLLSFFCVHDSWTDETAVSHTNQEVSPL